MFSLIVGWVEACVQAEGLRDHTSNSSSNSVKSASSVSSSNSVDRTNTSKDLTTAPGSDKASSQGDAKDEGHLNAVVELIKLLISAEVRNQERIRPILDYSFSPYICGIVCKSAVLISVAKRVVHVFGLELFVFVCTICFVLHVRLPPPSVKTTTALQTGGLPHAALVRRKAVGV